MFYADKTMFYEKQGTFYYKKEWTCSGTRLVPSQVLHFFGLKPCKNAIFKGSCSETEVSEQL